MRIIIALLILTSSFAFAQEGKNVKELDSTDTDIRFYEGWGQISKGYQIGETSNLNFEPLIANPYEARMGFIGQPSEERLRMDIGASFDLIEISKNGTFGVDMMTYTRLRSEGRFKFPVETTDYYFGVNTAFRFYDKPIFGRLFYGHEQLRIRLAHISSHLIDGYTTDNEFITPPFVYSREFLEVIYKVNHDYADYDLPIKISPYLGVNYIFSKIPNNIESFELITGLELNRYFMNGISFQAGYNFTLKGFDDTYYGVSNAQAGIKFNLAKGRAIFVGVYLYDGLSMHGMFFNQKDSYIGIGTQIYYF
jgi:uncharacterized protein DUF1207